jgi:exodeoxyribonuclease VII large subunit
MNAISVSELAASLKETLESEFPGVWVRGEITGVVLPASGHIYFNVKDAGAVVACVVWKSSVGRLKTRPANGVEVFLRGQATFYAGSGKCQLIVNAVEGQGLGAAELALQALTEKLAKQGYFDAKRKRALPAFPRRVGVVTSLSGAAVRDMLELFSRRWPLCEVVVVDARVQGEAAPAELAAGLRLLAAEHAAGRWPLDAAIVGRGGGSKEDLAAFNSEAVADAIFAAPFPVISAVGHEIDFTLADKVADVRAETPTAAVELLVPNRAEFLADLESQSARLRGALSGRLRVARKQLDQFAGRTALREPLDRIRTREQKLDELGERLARAAERRLEATREKLTAAAAQLQSLSPLKVLARGYSLTLRDGGKLLRSAAEVSPGDRLETRTAAGTVVSRVESASP